MNRWYRLGGKRLLDLLLSSLGLAFFAIPMIWMGWRIYCKSGASPIFRQTRIGEGGKPFTVLKFRTMSKSGQVYPFGTSLRATAMDELPQLIQILQGKMSCVGPRPLVPKDLETLAQIPEGEGRFWVRPGLTGLAQLYTEKSPSLSERLRWDLEYVRSCSLRLDLQILFRSILVSLRGGWERWSTRPIHERQEAFIG